MELSFSSGRTLRGVCFRPLPVSTGSLIRGARPDDEVTCLSTSPLLSPSSMDAPVLSGYSCRRWMASQEKGDGRALNPSLERHGCPAEGPAVITITTAPRCLCRRAATRDHIAWPLSGEEDCPAGFGPLVFSLPVQTAHFAV